MAMNDLELADGLCELHRKARALYDVALALDSFPGDPGDGLYAVCWMAESLADGIGDVRRALEAASAAGDGRADG